MPSSKHAERRRCARKSKNPNRTPTAPIAALSPKARATKRERDGRADDGRNPRRLPRGSRQAAMKVAEQRKPPRPSRKVNFHAAGKIPAAFSRDTMMTTKEKITAKDVQTLRQRTGAGMMESKKALEENNGDMEKAIEYLRTKGIAKAEKRVGKQTSEGVIGSYIHHNGKVGVMVEVNCETDFVARTDDFKQLVKYIAEHITAAAPVAVDKDQVPQDKVEKERRIFLEQVKESGKPDHLIEKIVAGKIESYYKDVALVHQAWVREPKKSVGDLIKEASAKLGENIQVRRFVRFQMGEE